MNDISQKLEEAIRQAIAEHGLEESEIQGFTDALNAGFQQVVKQAAARAKAGTGNPAVLREKYKAELKAVAGNASKVAELKNKYRHLGLTDLW